MVFSRELPHSFAEALRLCREILSSHHALVRKNLLDTEAEQLVIGAHRLTTGEKLSRADFYSRMQDGYPEASGSRLLILAGQRAEGMLLQHLLGWQTFLSHDYEVDSSTLIPRPETEILVHEAIQSLSTIRVGDRLGPELGIEIGLGTGVISIELLHVFPALKMVSSEVSEGALELATRNAVNILGSADRIQKVQPASGLDVLGPFLGMKADFLISNPPYLDSRRKAEIDSDVLEHEPATALFPANSIGSEHDPLYFYKKIALGAPLLLKPGGKLFLEIASERAEATLHLFEKHWKIGLISDLGGKPRVLMGELKEKV